MATAPESERRRLFKLVQYEHLSPSEAEDQLKAKGLKPFEERPDPANFDPMAAEEWTLPMAAAHFIWRSVDAVRDQWNPAREGWRMWVPLPRRPGAGPRGPRWELKRFGPATLADVFEQARLPSRTSRRTNTVVQSAEGSRPRTHNPYDRLKLALQSSGLTTTSGSRFESDFEVRSADYWRRNFALKANARGNVAARRPQPSKLSIEERRNPTNMGSPIEKIAQLARVSPLKMDRIKFPIPTEDEIDSFLASVAADNEKAAIEESAKRDAGVIQQEYLDDIFVLRDDVIKVEREISQLEYDGFDWDLGQALGSIAYQGKHNFRSLQDTDLNPRPTYYGVAYPADFLTPDPAGTLRDALILGNITGYVGGVPVAREEWLELTVWDCPGVKFKSADVRKFRIKPDTQVRPKNKRVSDAEMEKLHAKLSEDLGRPIGVNAFYNIAKVQGCTRQQAVKVHRKMDPTATEIGPKRAPRKLPPNSQ